MRKHWHKFETTMWIYIRGILYISLLMIFIVVMGKGSIGLTRLSRTLGITMSTFAIVGMLFISVYGKYDVGRRKSKPIIHSLSLSVLCTDVITYVQLMIMKTNTPSLRAFQLFRIKHLLLLLVVMVIQVIVIIVLTYFGNWLFFKIHEPEKCLVITSSQESLDAIAFAISRFKKQYNVHKVLDYRSDQLEKWIRQSETIFLQDVPAETRRKIMRWSYKYKKNIYFNPEIEDIMEWNAKQYVLDDVYLLNKNVKALTMEQRIAKRLLDIILSLVLGILSSPLWIAAMIAIKLDDGGPIFFLQERATIHGRRFQVYKLRTMKQNVENYSSTADDDRITRPGKFLRRTRIDE